MCSLTLKADSLKQERYMFNKELLDILVCPVSKAKLEYDEKEKLLVCHESRLKYPIEDDIPIMLPERAEKF